MKQENRRPQNSSESASIKKSNPQQKTVDWPADAVERIKTFRYVAHSQIAAFESHGWIVSADLGPTHGSYSVLMEIP